MTRTTDITSFTEHRNNLRDHLNRLKQTGRPLYITTDGVPEAVVLSAQAYDELADRADMAQTLAMLHASDAELKAGKALDARKAIKSLERKPTTGRDKK